MIIIKLVHPRLGVVALKETSRCYTKELMTQWRFKYGKKFNECRIEIDGVSEKRKTYVKKKPNGSLQMPGKNKIYHRAPTKY